MPFKYARFGGTIDWFDFTMTGQDLISKAAYDTVNHIIDPEAAKITAEHIQACIDQINAIVYNQTQENPVIIRFFSIPNFDSNKFNIYAVAKIKGNGSTYLFGNNQELLEILAPGGFDLKYLQKD